MIINMILLMVIMVLIFKEVSVIPIEEHEEERDALPTQEGRFIPSFVLSKEQRDESARTLDSVPTPVPTQDRPLD